MAYDGPVKDVFAEQVIATYGPLTEPQAEVLAEIGGMRYQAIYHFVSDADFKAYHQGDFAGAYSEYAKALSVLVTAKARRMFASNLLDCMRDSAVEAGDANLIMQADTLTTAFQQEIAGRSAPMDPYIKQYFGVLNKGKWV